jgi:predicted flap endonuclease-1-like 5' DNA nuclease
MGPVIQEFLLCLLPAAAIGTVVGWILKKLSLEDQQVGITRFELEVKLTAAERKLASLQKELEASQQTTQDKTSQASIAGEELAQVRAQLADREELVHGLRTRLSSLEALPVKLATHEATIADLRARLVVLEGLPEMLKERESELDRLRMQFGDMVPKSRLDEQQADIKGQLETLQSQLAESKAVAGQEETWARQVLSERDETIEHLHEELAHLQRSVSDLTAMKAVLAERDITISTLRKELELFQSVAQERDALQASVEEREAVISRLQASMTEADRAALDLRQRLASFEETAREVDDLRETVAQSQHRLTEREEEIAHLQQKLDEMVPVSEAERLRAKLKTLKQQVVAPAKLNRTSPPKWGAEAPDRNLQDDLKRIWGVGPALERLLHKQGIYYFRQIASWTKEDIQVIDSKLDTFKGRILRDNWIKGAKDEHFRKYGERL